MNEPRNTNSNGGRLLFVSWFFYPLVFIVAMWLLPFHKLSYSVMGIIYQAYVVAAVYFSVFCTLSVIKYQHPHWVRIVYACGMLFWCCGFHYLFGQMLGAC